MVKNVLITCDSIKNWQVKDQFFSEETFEDMKTQGSIGQANIDNTWLSAMKPSKEELKAILDLDFSILITAHGPPLLDNPKEKIANNLGGMKNIICNIKERVDGKNFLAKSLSNKVRY